MPLVGDCVGVLSICTCAPFGASFGFIRSSIEPLEWSLCKAFASEDEFLTGLADVAPSFGDTDAFGVELVIGGATTLSPRWSFDRVKRTEQLTQRSNRTKFPSLPMVT